MKISFNNDSGNFTLNIQGRLDTTSTCEYEEFINANLSQIKALTINCQDLEYVSSAGLRVLLATQKKLQNSLKLINVQELVMEVFEMTGFTDILCIEA